MNPVNHELIKRIYKLTDWIVPEEEMQYLLDKLPPRIDGARLTLENYMESGEEWVAAYAFLEQEDDYPYMAYDNELQNAVAKLVILLLEKGIKL